MSGFIALEWDNNTYQADLGLDDNGLIRKDGAFETTSITSLFSWARDESANTVELPQKFGWWGNSFSDSESDNYGSLLWTFRRAKNSFEARSRLERTVLDAFDWMLQDEVAQSVDAEVERFDLQTVALKVSIARADGKRWDNIWEIQRSAIL